jgi:hypothetical protein
LLSLPARPKKPRRVAWVNDRASRARFFSALKPLQISATYSDLL